jgi:ferrous-iron efflux pump FieF
MTAEPQIGPRPSGARQQALMRRATYASTATACVLVVVKAGAWVLTDSISLLSTLIDSLLDVAASAVNLMAVRHALIPADREHRFGHGKLEPLAALGQAAFVTGSALFLVIAAGQRFVSPRPVQAGEVGIAVMLVSIAATVALVTYQRSVVRRTGSLAVQADSLHYLGDLLTNAAVIVAILLWMQTGWTWVDPAFAIAIAAYILITAARIARGAFDMLMDRELPEAERRRIVEIVRQHPQVIGLHDLRTRASGPHSFIQLHLELDGRMNLYQANVIADTVETDLRNAFPDAEVIIHQDPHGVDDDSTPLPAWAEAAGCGDGTDRGGD